MDVLEKAAKILEQPVCDNCLGRQFGQLLSGHNNAQRGAALRTAAAMSIDKGKDENKEEKREANKQQTGAQSAPVRSEAGSIGAFPVSGKLDLSNFSDFSFHNLEVGKIKRKKCSVCGGFFENIDKYAAKAVEAAKKYHFRTFLVGTKLPFHMIEAEEALWERVGIDYCEPLKAEINREVGKLIEKRMKARFDRKSPDVNIIMNVASGRIDVGVNPLFIYGEYQKLKRGIPQTKWPSGKYKTSVEQVIAKPFMRATRASAHKLHGLGREDIDARCLGWRPFVLELLEPASRDFDIRKLSKKIEKSVRARKMRRSNIAEVRRIKETRCDKTYSLVVECAKKIDKADLRRLPSITLVNQKTPERVLHRRADKYRKRRVRSLKARLIGPKRFRLFATCEAGLYIKELVTGDSGRTKPSISELLGAKCTPKDLDVIKIHVKNK